MTLNILTMQLVIEDQVPIFSNEDVRKALIDNECKLKFTNNFDLEGYPESLTVSFESQSSSVLVTLDVSECAVLIAFLTGFVNTQN